MEPAPRFSREGFEGVDGYEIERTLNIVGGLLGVRLLCALPEWVGTTVLKVAGVVYTARGSFLRTSKLLWLMCPMRRCHSAADSDAKTRPSDARPRTIWPPAPPP